jgi:hypothetical protein
LSPELDIKTSVSTRWFERIAGTAIWLVASGDYLASTDYGAKRSGSMRLLNWDKGYVRHPAVE